MIRRTALTLALAAAGLLAAVAPASAAMTPPPSTCSPVKVCHTKPTTRGPFVRHNLPSLPIARR